MTIPRVDFAIRNTSIGNWGPLAPIVVHDFRSDLPVFARFKPDQAYNPAIRGSVQLPGGQQVRDKDQADLEHYLRESSFAIMATTPATLTSSTN